MMCYEVLMSLAKNPSAIRHCNTLTCSPLIFANRRTNSDGRLPGLLTKQQFTPGTYKVRFETEDYFNQTGTEGFYPYAEVIKSFKEVQFHYFNH